MAIPTNSSGPQFERKQYLFDQFGVDLNAPVDRAKDGLAVAMENWRPEIDGALTIRPGQGNGLTIVAGQSPVHSLLRMQDTSSGSLVEAIFAGAGTHIGLSDVALTTPADLGSGWASEPKSIFVHQPTESVKPYCYICDSLKVAKFDVTGAAKQVGLARPVFAPFAVLSSPPQHKSIDGMNVAANWLVGGTAAALAAVLRADPATRSITAIKYDLPLFTTGWACVQPNSMADIGKGMELSVVGANPETFTVQEVYQGSAQTTIAAAKTDSFTGDTWIHLTTPSDQVVVDSLILLDSGGIRGGPEYVRVLAVERTKTGFTSFQCATLNSYSGGETAQVVPSFRAFFTAAHVATDPLTATSLQFTVAVGAGSITRNVGAATPIDMSSINTGVPTGPDDILHISVLIDKPELVTEIKVFFDIDSGTTNVFSAADHTKNYLFHSIRQNDLVPVTKGTQTALDNAALRAQRIILDQIALEGLSGSDGLRAEQRRIDALNRQLGRLEDPTVPTGPGAGTGKAPPPNNTTAQTSSGQNSYAEIFFRVSELLTPGVGRVGSDFSRGLPNVAALKVEVTTTGNVTVRVDALTLNGGFGPDVSVAGQPRIYRYRYRDSQTGVVSNWSPAFRGGVVPQRQKVDVTLNGSGVADVDKLDVAIYGGDLLGWAYAGSVDNPGGGNATFFDTFSEFDLAVAQPLTEGNVHYQLWPVVSTPVKGTGQGIGTLFTIATGVINTATAPGTALKVDGLDYTLYRVLSVNSFETVESMGNTGAGKTWEIAAPLIENVRLPTMFGPFQGFYFGLGDKLNPWRLYYTNGNDPDSTQDVNWIDIESEILQNGLVTTDERCFVWSTEHVFAIDPAFTALSTGGGLFAFRRIGAVGLPFKYALCDMGGAAAFMGRTGIHATSGGQVQPLSEDLRSIFPHEGSGGVLTNGFYPPDLSSPNNLRPSFIRGELFFDYLDTNGGRRTLVRHMSADGRAGWRPYVYAVGAQVHYAEEGNKITSVLIGGVDGKVYRLGRTQADAAGAAIAATLQVRSEDGGDAVVSKYVGDFLFDYDTAGATVNVTPGYDNFASTPDGTFVLVDAAGRRQRRLDIGAPVGSGRRARNVALRIASAVTTLRPVIYLWQPSWEPRPETTLLRAHDYHLAGGGGVKYVRGVWIYADTYGANRSVTLEFTTDDGTVSNVVIPNVNHSALTERYYPLSGGLYMIGSRARPTDSNVWDFEGYRLDGESAPPLSTEVPEWTDFKEARFVQGVRYEIDTQNAPVNMLVRVDENAQQTIIQTGANSGPVLANGRAIKAYSFDAPFITHLIRSEPSAPCRVWNAEYISEPEPELAYMWWSQQTDCGMDGFKYFGDGQITVRSTDNLILEFDLDGAGTFAHAAVFYDANTNSGGQRRAYRFRCPVMKCKVVQPRLRCATLAGRAALFKKEFMIEVKGWGAYHVSIDGKPIGTPWQSINILGDIHMESGARI